jgi:branched-chain amino acid transport system permease protein
MSFPVVLGQATADESAFYKALDTLIDGLSLGAIYALLALGFVLIFKATQVINFAHGALAAVGGYITFWFAISRDFPGQFMAGLPSWLDWFPWVLSAILAMAVTGALGFLLERIFIQPMIGEPLFSVAIITLGIDFILRTVNDDFIGVDPKPLGQPWGADVASFGSGQVTIAHTQIVTFITTALLVVGLGWFFRSRMGIAMRATAFDQEAAMAQGISVARVFALAWIIGAALAAAAGVFSSVFPRSLGIDRGTAFVAFRAFPAVIVGGLDSVAGAVVGGLIIGVAEIAVGVYLSTWTWLGAGFSGIVPWLVMMVVLLVRPYGLFGTEEIRRV